MGNKVCAVVVVVVVVVVESTMETENIDGKKTSKSINYISIPVEVNPPNHLTAMKMNARIELRYTS